MYFWAFIFAIPLLGIVYAGFTSFLKYRQNRAMLDVLKVYAERGEAPPEEVLTALTNGFSLAEEGMSAPKRIPVGTLKVQGAMHYWSLVGLFSVFTAGFAFAAWGSSSLSNPFTIVAFTMGAVAVWALVMAIGLSVKKK